MKIAFKQYWTLLITYLRPQRRRVLTLAALLLASIALQIANPQLLRYFIDTAQNPQSELRALFIAAGLFIGIALVTQLLALAATYVSEIVAWSATNDLRGDLALHCLRLDMAFHKARTPGELIERIDGDVTALANFFSQFVIRVLGNVILMFGVLIVLLIEDYRFGLVMTVLAALLFVALLGVQRAVVPFWAKARESSAALFGFLEERLSGTEDIRSSGAIDYTMNRLYERSRDRLHNERRAAVIGASAWMTPLLFFAIASALTYWLGYRFFTAGTMTLGTVYLIFFYTEALLRPVIQITRQIEDLQKAGAGIVRVQELYSMQPSLADGHSELPARALAVEFDAVTFAYDDERWSVARGPSQPRSGSDSRVSFSGADASTTHAAGGQLPVASDHLTELLGAGSQPLADEIGAPETTDNGHPPTGNRYQAVLLDSIDHGPAATDNGLDTVLHHISFRIAAGRTLGILGRTGSGKTTLTRLLFRLYDVSAGTIRLGGTDIRGVKLDSLRQRVGMVTQEVQLFHATVRENLTFFDPNIPDERILSVLGELELLPWYQSLPNGLDSMLAAGSGGLSAGEAQVLAFTRVFLREPGLVILDEASSRLDPATERLIERAVDRLLANRTGIVIAHRLATVLRADDILILEDGRIREYGQLEALRHDPESRFAELLRTGMEEVLV
jgi:ABC-type multidrug transport system fused ATPase/permease subunit